MLLLTFILLHQQHSQMKALLLQNRSDGINFKPQLNREKAGIKAVVR